MKASDGMFLDSVVYVTTQGTQVRTDGGQIVVYDVDGDEGELGTFPTKQVETINVFGGVNFSTPFVAEANEHGIVLNYFTQQGKTAGASSPNGIRSRRFAVHSTRSTTQSNSISPKQ